MLGLVGTVSGGGNVMKKLDELLDKVDQQVEKSITPLWMHIQKYFVIFSATLLTVLLIIFFYRIFHDRSTVLSSVVKDDLLRIERVLNQIDKDCNILSIRAERAFVDFFTVEKFTGSTVGCLNLAYPKKWKGPYLQQNPSVQGKLYEIVKTKDGYFVIPGQGVSLPNRLTMGKDIVITSATTILPMLQSGGRLVYQGQPLAIQLKFKVGDWDTPRPSQTTIDKINQMLKEFNEALPYAQGECTTPIKKC